MKNKINVSINLDEISDDLNQSIDFLTRKKVKYAEIRTINGKNIVDFDLAEVKNIARLLFKKGLKISAIASPLFKWYLDPTGSKVQHDNFSFDPSLDEKQKKDYILKTIKIAEIFETKNVRVFSNLRQDGVDTKEIFKDRMFEYMLEQFLEFGLNPLLENEPVCLISKAKDYLEVLQKYESKGLKAWWDIANSYDVGDVVNGDLIQSLKPYIEYLHVKDKVSASGKDYIPLGSGFINYKQIFSDLVPTLDKSIFVSIETHVHSNKIEATKTSLEYLNNLFHKQRISYAIVGAGRISKNHSQAIKQNNNSELRGVFDIDIKKAKFFAVENDVRVYKNLDSLLSDPKIRVINICTPHNTHLEIAQKAISEGKIVLSEKPFALNSKDLNKYLKNKKAVENTYVVFQNLFNRPVQKLLDSFKKGKFGKLQFISVNIKWSRDDNYFNNWHGKIALSGGSLFNQAIHSIQLVHLLLGDRIEKTSYIKRTFRTNSEVEDAGVAILKSKDGTLGYLELCLVNKGENLESSIYLTGEKGSMKISGRSLNNLVYEYFEGQKTGQNVAPDNLESIYGSGHVSVIKTLSNKLLGKKNKDKKYLTKAKDVLPVIKLIEKIYGNS